jgi:hypothetical protein
LNRSLSAALDVHQPLIDPVSGRPAGNGDDDGVRIEHEVQTGDATQVRKKIRRRRGTIGGVRAICALA